MQGRRAGRSEVRSALRAATGAVHDRLHHAPPFAAIAKEQLDLCGYRQFLGRIAALHLTVGEELGLGPARRRLLLRDLDGFGAPAPDPLPWNPPKSSAARLGWAYVLEGSSVGGRVIYKQLDYLFGRSPHGRLFFRGSPSDGSRWQGLCRDLEIEGQTGGTVDEIVGGATAAFALFEQVLVPEMAE